MHLTEFQLRQVVRRTLSELFVRPKHRKSVIKRALSREYQGPEYGGAVEDYGFGEFEEADGELSEDDSQDAKGEKVFTF